MKLLGKLNILAASVLVSVCGLTALVEVSIS